MMVDIRLKLYQQVKNELKRVNGTAKTKAEAQVIVDEKTNAYQIAWDATNEAGTDEEKELYSMRQETYTLP